MYCGYGYYYVRIKAKASVNNFKNRLDDHTRNAETPTTRTFNVEKGHGQNHQLISFILALTTIYRTLQDGAPIGGYH
jgi:hypothetical protein